MRPSGFVAALLFLGTCLWLPKANAYKISQSYCGGDLYRDPGGWPVRELCKTPFGLLTNASDPGGNGYSQARAAMISAHWMWVREGTSDATLFVDQSTCGDGFGTGWWDGINEINDVWWESLSDIQAHCPGAGGCTATDEATCIWPVNTSVRIIATDIMVASDKDYSVTNQNSMLDCLTFGANHETLWMHEIGHAYGLNHDSATVSIFNRYAPNCHVAQGFHTYPYPDDISGLMKHHKGYSGTKVNVAGSAWIREAGADTLSTPRISVTEAQTKNLTISLALHGYYSSTTMTAQLWLVPEAQVPSYDSAAKKWSFGTKGVKTGWFEQSSFGVTSKQVSITAPVSGSWLWQGTTYRVWVQVDPNRAVLETDEGDNVFPTAALVDRI